MSTYLVGQIAVRDHDIWQQYVAGVSESLMPFESKIIFRGTRSATLAGENNRELVMVIEFADQPTLDSWFNSDKYQSLIPLRDQAADVIITIYEAADDQ